MTALIDDLEQSLPSRANSPKRRGKQT